MNWKNNYFAIFEGIFVLLGAGIILYFNKGELELLANQQLPNRILDQFFKYATHLGDGFILLPSLVILLFVKYRYAITLAVMALYQLILVHVNKRILFSGMARPKIFLEEHNLHFVEGVDVHGYNTFPSGHTTTAFAVFFLFALVVKNRGWSILFFLVGLTVGISRVYLLQHFFIDIYAGSILGCLATILAVYTMKKFENTPSLDRKITI